MTVVTGLVDAVSFLSLGARFTANMTEYRALAFATAHVSGLSIARSLTALLAFLVGAILWRTCHGPGESRFTDATLRLQHSCWRSPFCWLRRLRYRLPSRFFSAVCSDA